MLRLRLQAILQGYLTKPKNILKIIIHKYTIQIN